MQPGTLRLSHAAAASLVVVSVLCGPAAAYTTPTEMSNFLDFKAEMEPRSKNWQQATQTWTCPTLAINSDGTCDPCGKDQEGNWYHLHCRGNSQGWGESGDGVRDGMLTNVHITLENVDGPPPREACKFKNIREFDFKGSHLVGPVPEWLSCLSDLQELDMSSARLSGTMPASLAAMPLLSEIKYNNNYGIFGPIPEEYGSMAGLRRLLLDSNRITGTIPATFMQNNESPMTQIGISNTLLQGDLYALGAMRLVVVNLYSTPGLCGMMPRTVRFAAQFNPAGTNLGQPCPNERVGELLGMAPQPAASQPQAAATPSAVAEAPMAATSNPAAAPPPVVATGSAP